MSKGFTGSICIEQQFEGRIVTGSNGKKYVCIDDLTNGAFNVGKTNGLHYQQIVLWVNDVTDDRGNDGSIQISMSKEERLAGAKAKYMGNIKLMQVAGTAASPGVQQSGGAATSDLPDLTLRTLPF